MTTTTKRKDFLGRWLGNAHPGSSAATDHLGRSIVSGNKDFLGRSLAFDNPSAWTTGHTYAAGDYVTVASGTDYSGVFVAQDGGTSDAATEPTWPSQNYGTVVDNAGTNSITWKRVHA